MPHHPLVKSLISFSLGTKNIFTLSIFLACSVSALYATAATLAPNTLPTNGQVVAGSATISQSQTSNAATMNVNQTTQRAVINWDNFNVGKNATVNFNQPNAGAVTLNRVTGGNASVIEGALRANGQVVFVNENGVTFGKGATINAAGVVATTMNIADKDFMDGKSTYQGNGTGAVINEGKIKTNVDGGYIALLAPEVRNDGYLIAKKGSGTVALGSGEQITLDFKGNSLISLKVDKAAYQALIENKRVVEVNGGLVVIAAGSANQLMATVIKNTGKISASSMINNGGVIELVANTVTQAGKVAANSQTAQGGQVNIVGNDITVAQSSKTTATGATGGGQVNIGLATTKVSGGAQVNTVAPPAPATIAANASQAAQSNQMAKTVTVEPNAVIDASATKAGNGGTIAIWSQVQTTIAGILQSMGGTLSGNGGFIETSSKGQVSITQAMSINTSSNNKTGKSGTWLLDPLDLTIDQAAANIIAASLANSNVTIAVTANTTACPIGTCTQNGTGSLTIASGADILKAGTNYTTLTLSSAGIFNLNANISGQNLDVIISSSIAYLNVGSSINASKVTVQAQTIYSAGSIQTNSYLNNANPGSLGNAIQLLAQAIYVSGRLSANAPVGVAGSIKLEANTITLQSGAVLETNAQEGGQITVAANDSVWSSAVIQANGGNGRGGTLAITAANDLHFDQALLQANGTTDGGAITITTASGDLIIQNSTIQTNGSNGRGGSIGTSASNNVTFQNAIINASGFTQGGTIKIGNDADHGTLPFALLTSLDQYTSISAAQTDPNTANKNGGFIETSGHTISLLASINAGRGGMWLLDPYDITISGPGQPVSGTPFTYSTGSSYAYTASASSIVPASAISSALNSAAVTVITGSGSITVNDVISGVHSLTLLAGGGNIQLNSGIHLTGVGSSIILRASGYISTNGSNTFQTNGGDIIFWSNTGNVTSVSATNANFIYVDAGTRIFTNGGALYLAGGASSTGSNTTANGNFYPLGYAFTGSRADVLASSGGVGVLSGILLGPYAGTGTAIIINTGGGDVVIAGQTTATFMPGMSSQSNFVIDSGSGNITLLGTSHNGHGIELGYGSVNSNIVITSTSTSPTAIQITGSSEAGGIYKGFWAIHLANGSTPGVLIQETGLGGGITITGINAPSGVGMYLSDIAILASSGPIHINASSLVMQATSAYVGACSGLAYPCGAHLVGGNSYLPISSSASNIFMNVDARNVGPYVWGGVLTIDTTASLKIAPYTFDGWSGSTFNWSGANILSGGMVTFSADINSFIGAPNEFIVRNITGLTIGDRNSTNTVNINQDISPFGNITIFGGRVNFNSALVGLVGNLTVLATTNDININARASWGVGSTVTFLAYGNININAPLSAPTGTYIAYDGSYSGAVAIDLYVILNPGSSVSGRSPNLSYAIYTDPSGTMPASSAIANLVSGAVNWSGLALDSNTPAGTYSLQYSSGLIVSNPIFTLSAGNAKTWTITAAPIPLSVAPPPPPLAPIYVPPPPVIAAAPPPPPPAAAPVMVVVAPPPGAGAEGVAPPPGQAVPPPRATMAIVASDGTVSLGVAPTPAAPAATPTSPPVPPAPAAPPSASSSSSSSSGGSSASSSADGKSSSSKDGNGKSERVGKYDAKKLAALKEADKTDAKKSSAGTAASKYAGKYANGFRAAERVAAKETTKEGAKEGVAKPGTLTAKAAPPREGKYSNRLNALANSGTVNMPLAQNQLTATGLPPLPGAPVEVAVPTVLRGGDSLSQSYDDVPSIRNSGVANVGRSRNTENYHESLESVNLMSTLNLFIVH